MDAPAGFGYVADFVTPDEERALLAAVSEIAWAEVRMHGMTARRKVAHFGKGYVYASGALDDAPPLPAFLAPLRTRAATLAELAPDQLAEVLVTHYPPGAGIGWHRDAPAFGRVVGVSLAAPCRFKLRRGKPGAWEVRTIELPPRSAYLLRGAVRWTWQHSIVPVELERYSVTFRSLRAGR